MTFSRFIFFLSRILCMLFVFCYSKDFHSGMDY